MVLEFLTRNEFSKIGFEDDFSETRLKKRDRQQKQIQFRCVVNFRYLEISFVGKKQLAKLLKALVAMKLNMQKNV